MQAPLPQVTAKSRFSGKDKGTAGTRINPSLPTVPLSYTNSSKTVILLWNLMEVLIYQTIFDYAFSHRFLLFQTT